MPLPYIPQPLPDELLYSWLGRVALLNDLGPVRERIRSLFGDESVTPSVDIPAGVSKLHRVLGEQMPWSSAEVTLEQTTLWPYYRPFLGGKAAKVVGAFLAGQAIGVRTLMGSVASRLGVVPRLRYCPKCLDADGRRPRMPFWRRAHHLPCVQACPEHQCLLQFLTGTLASPGRQELLLPPLHTPAATATATALQVKIARMSEQLLQAQLDTFDTPTLARTYRSSLQQHGYVRLRAEHAVVDYGRFGLDLLNFYDQFAGLDCHERLVPGGLPQLPWLPALLRTDRCCHPLLHLLVATFLFGDFAALLRAYESEQTLAPSAPVHAPSKRDGSATSRRLHRTRWRKALSATDGQGIRAARQVDSAAYSWLYRHDRAWLAGSSRNHRLHRGGRRLVDWGARDAALCEKARAFSEALRVERPRARLSKTLLLRALGGVSVRNNLQKMPHLRELVEALAVDVVSAQKARIDAAIVSLGSTHSSLTWSAVMRQAGIRSWTADLRHHTQLRLAKVALRLHE